MGRDFQSPTFGEPDRYKECEERFATYVQYL